MTNQDDATLDIPGTWNARDAATLTGLAPGVLLRSAALPGLTDAGRAELAALGVTDVVDLRSAREVAEQGKDAVATEVTVHEVPIMPGSPLGPATEDDIVPTTMDTFLERLREPGFAQHLLDSVYVDIVTDPEWVAQLGRALTVIADAEGATLVHCSAGKDRTGVLVALAAAIAGADSTGIDADYLYSNRAADAQTATLPPGIPVADLPLLAPLLGVHQSSLDAARTAIEQHYGGLPGFLDAAGVSDETQRKLRSRLAPQTH